MRDTIVVTALLGFLVGCSPEVDETSAATSCGFVDEIGGVVENGDARVQFPFGALSSEIAVCLTRTTGPAPDGFAARSPVFSITPRDLPLRAPAQVTLPYRGASDEAGVYWSDRSGDYAWVGGILTNSEARAVTVAVDQLGDGFVAVPARVEEAFEPVRPAVDLLFVVDTSCSMIEEQESLAASFDEFFPPLAGVDYHIGVVTTNMVAERDPGYDPTKSGRLQTSAGYRFIDANTPDPAARFKEMVLLGTDEHADEMGLLAVYTAIDVLGATDNYGFYRDDADLLVVVLSDEDDYSYMASSPMDTSTFIAWFGALKDATAQVSFSAFVGDDRGNGATCPTAVEAGIRYEQVSDAFDGIEYAICDELDAGMTRVTDWIVAPSRVFALAHAAEASSIEVAFESGGEPSFLLDGEEWSYDVEEHTITLLGEAPESGTRVLVSYLPAP